MDQQRLFDPGPAQEGVDPWRNHPDDWVQRPDIVYHSTSQPSLPRKDRGSGVSSVLYGESAGMHFGTKRAAIDRTVNHDSNYVHTARLNTHQFKPIQGSRWSDDDANYNPVVNQQVKDGWAIPYENEFEDPGSTSYRVRPESVRTWSEDVQADPHAHPALKHLASRNYDPMIKLSEDDKKRATPFGRPADTPTQQAIWPLAKTKAGREVAYGGGEIIDQLASVPLATRTQQQLGFKDLNMEQFTPGDRPESRVPRLERRPG